MLMVQTAQLKARKDREEYRRRRRRRSWGAAEPLEDGRRRRRIQRKETKRTTLNASSVRLRSFSLNELWNRSEPERMLMFKVISPLFMWYYVNVSWSHSWFQWVLSKWYCPIFRGLVCFHGSGHSGPPRIHFFHLTPTIFEINTQSWTLISYFTWKLIGPSQCYCHAYVMRECIAFPHASSISKK